MPKIIGKSTIVVETPDGTLKIDELAGNVATTNDTISIAYVTISNPTSEPWLTLDYDEWICVRKGYMILEFFDKDEKTVKKELEVKAGETVFVEKGERFRPIFPTGGTEYIPVCLPAFRPDRCHREETVEESEENGVTSKLSDLHGMKTKIATASENSCAAIVPGSDPDKLYHMCQLDLWEEVTKSGKAYFPPTFEQDGFFTHATAVPSRLIGTANHFYTATKGKWICLELSRGTLHDLGIITKDEGGLPVGEQKISDDWVNSKWICPHIYGGIPTKKELGVLRKTYPMNRDENGNFLSIEGLTD